MKNTWNYPLFFLFGILIELIILNFYQAPTSIWITSIFSSVGLFTLYRFLMDYRYFRNPIYRELKRHFISNDPIEKIFFSSIIGLGLVFVNSQLISLGAYWGSLFWVGFLSTLTMSTIVNAVRVALLNKKNVRRCKNGFATRFNETS